MNNINDIRIGVYCCIPLYILYLNKKKSKTCIIKIKIVNNMAIDEETKGYTLWITSIPIRMRIVPIISKPNRFNKWKRESQKKVKYLTLITQKKIPTKIIFKEKTNSFVWFLSRILPYFFN